MKNKIFELFFQIQIKSLFKDSSQNGYKYFLNPKDIKDWGDSYDRYFSDLWQRMNRLEVANEMAFEWETLKFYTGYKSLELNKLLRGENVYFQDQCYDRIETLANCIEKFSLHENVIVIRRIKNKHWNSLIKKGSIFTDKAFLSTSLNMNYRKDINGNYSNFKNETIILFKVPKGTKACYIESVSKREEFELLIQKGSRYKIEKTRLFLGNRIVIASIL
jgi:hypothetical protein